MAANSLGEIIEQIKGDMKNALLDAQTQSELIMHDAILGFYAGGTPTMYARTGALGQTPATESIDDGFRTYLNQSGGYSTGKKPTMKQVIQLTDTGAAAGLRPAVGAPGYWDKAEEQIKDAVNDAFSHYFR